MVDFDFTSPPSPSAGPPINARRRRSPPPAGGANGDAGDQPSSASPSKSRASSGPMLASHRIDPDLLEVILIDLRSIIFFFLRTRALRCEGKGPNSEPGAIARVPLIAKALGIPLADLVGPLSPAVKKALMQYPSFQPYFGAESERVEHADPVQEVEPLVENDD